MSKTYLRPKPQPVYLTGNAAQSAWDHWRARTRRKEWRLLRGARAEWRRKSGKRKQRWLAKWVEDMVSKRQKVSE